MNDQDQKIHNALIVIKDMLKHRNIDTSSFSPETGVWINPFDVLLGEGSNKVWVFVNLGVKSKQQTPFAKENSDVKYRIIVHTDKLTMKDAELYNSYKQDYQFFQIRDLQFDVSKHMLVPKHELISDRALISQIVKDHCVKNTSQFPSILRSDPMAKYLYAKTGDLVKVTRISQTACHHEVFRCVV